MSMKAIARTVVVVYIALVLGPSIAGGQERRTTPMDYHDLIRLARVESPSQLALDIGGYCFRIRPEDRDSLWNTMRARPDASEEAATKTLTLIDSQACPAEA